MHYFVMILLIVLAGGCGGKALQDKEAPRILTLSIEANSSCEIGGETVPCLRQNSSGDSTPVDVRITASDNVGIAGYYITEAFLVPPNWLVPPDWISIIPAPISYSSAVRYNLTSGDGTKNIYVWLKDLSGNISEIKSAGIIVVSGETAEWKKETIDERRDFEDGLFVHALMIDSNRSPHIVYGSQKLYSASLNNNRWTLNGLDGLDLYPGGFNTGSLIDSAGSVHLSYMDRNNNLIYATNSSDTWIVTTVDNSGAVGGASGIAQGAGDLHTSYYDAANGDLKYAACASDCTHSDRWVTTTLDSSGDVGLFSAIALGSDGSVHISYFDNTNNALKYITADNTGSWSLPVTVDSNAGIYSAIALDVGNKAHIAYYRSTGRLKYATNGSGSWVSTGLDEDSIAGRFISIAIDAADGIHISYYDGKSSGLKYITNTSGSWVTATIDDVGDTGWYNLIATDPDNHVYISYFDNANKAVRYAVCTSDCSNPSSWSTNRIDSSGDAGLYNSMVQDSTGKLHVSYLGGSDLRYATNSSGEWVPTIVDGSGSAGQYSSIAVDSAGSIHIAYYDAANIGLKYATCSSHCNEPVNWRLGTVAQALNVGLFYSSIAVDSSGTIHISYQDGESKILKYAACAGDCTADSDGDGIADHWITLTVNSSKVYSLGQYSSIAVDQSKRVHISYFDATNGDLKYASCETECTTDSDGDGVADHWITETVDEGEVNPANGSTDSVGWYTSTKVDSKGYVHISYLNETSGDLMYVTNKSGAWEKATIDRYDRAGVYTSLAIGPDDDVHIVYNRYSPGFTALKYAVCSADCTPDSINNLTGEGYSDGLADNWTTDILEIFKKESMFSSIAVGSDVSIIYHDPDTDSLKYIINQ